MKYLIVVGVLALTACGQAHPTVIKTCGSILTPYTVEEQRHIADIIRTSKDELEKRWLIDSIIVRIHIRECQESK